MRHRNKLKKLGRTSAHRKATLQNLAGAIITNQQIRTTQAKAKAARSLVERLITYGKKNTVASRRLAFKYLQNHMLVKKLFDEIAPTFADRNGGYTRIIKLGQRRGDGAEMAVLQLVGFEPMIIDEKKAAKKKAKKKTTRAKTEAAAAPEAVEEKAAETPEQPEEERAEPKKAKKAKAAKPAKEAAAKEETPAETPAEEVTEAKEEAEEKTEAKAEPEEKEDSGGASTEGEPEEEKKD